MITSDVLPRHSSTGALLSLHTKVDMTRFINQRSRTSKVCVKAGAGPK